MSRVICEGITDGLRISEVVACLKDYSGRNHFIRVERDFLSKTGNKSFLPIGVVHVDRAKRLVLVELPHEAETGANRLWVKQQQIDPSVENGL
jgi:hypothetical protein